MTNIFSSEKIFYSVFKNFGYKEVLLAG